MVDDASCHFDVIGHVTTRLPEVDFLWVVHCEHAFI